MMTRIVALRAKDTSPSYDRTERLIALDHEDADNWYGRPFDNPACPVLTYPRYAWKLAPA